MCSGQISRIEAAVHAARQAFDSEECEAALLVDATNAFNSLNHQAALHNIRCLCPPIATILVNPYRAPTEFFVNSDVILLQEGTTQGNPLAMAMYGLAKIPLIRRLKGPCKQVWYADDFAAFGPLEHLRSWWDRLTVEGPSFGYSANPSKTWLVTKDQHTQNAAKIFAGSGVNITSNGRPYLGTALGSSGFIEEHLRSKVREWTSSITLGPLSEIARSQPHAAYSALVHGLSGTWSYLSRVTPNINHLLPPLDTALRTKLLPALTTPNYLDCALFVLPARYGGLGIRIPSKNAERELQSSQQVTSVLVPHILEQNQKYGYDIIADQLKSKATISKQNKEMSSKEADNLYNQLPLQLQKEMELANEKGTSTWLTALPLKEHVFHCIRLPSKMLWPCDTDGFHQISCPSVTAKWNMHSHVPKEVSPPLGITKFMTSRPTSLQKCVARCALNPLQPTASNQLSGATANSQDGARLDVSANGVWGGRYENTFFDMRVFNPHTPSNKNETLSACYREHEREKKRAYEQRIHEVEHSSFIPLVLSATGGMGREAICFYKRTMLAQKWDYSYSTTLCWLRCCLTFSLIRSAIQAL